MPKLISSLKDVFTTRQNAIDSRGADHLVPTTIRSFASGNSCLRPFLCHLPRYIKGECEIQDGHVLVTVTAQLDALN
jgi:hypothetical protein